MKREVHYVLLYSSDVIPKENLTQNVTILKEHKTLYIYTTQDYLVGGLICCFRSYETHVSLCISYLSHNAGAGKM